jgi:hypothetical protein
MTVGKTRTAAALAAAFLMMAGGAGREARAARGGDAGSGKWLHVRVDGSENGKPEIVRVNFPLSLAIKLLPMVQDENLKDGKIQISGLTGEGDEGGGGGEGINAKQLRAMWNAVKETEDSEFVTVESEDESVKVAKAGSFFVIKAVGRHTAGDAESNGGATGKGGVERGKSRHETVDVKLPLDVVDALLSGPENELNLTAAIEALSKHDDSDLVLVNDEEETVRIWIDGRNSID